MTLSSLAGGRTRGRVLFGGSVLLGLVALWLSARGLEWPALQTALAAADGLWVGVAVLSVMATTLAKTARWQTLFHDAHSQTPFARLLSTLLMGQLVNFLSSARLGEPVRAALVGRGASGKGATVTTLALEKLTDLLALSALILVLPWLRLPDWIQVARWPALALAAILLIGLALAAYQRPLLERIIGWLLARVAWLNRLPLFPLVQGALAGAVVVRSRRATTKAVAWAVVVWALAALTNLACFRALGLDLGWPAAFFVLAVLQAGIAVPSTPGKVGVFQYLCVLALTPLGVARADAFAYSLLLYVVVYGTMAAWTALIVWRYGW